MKCDVCQADVVDNENLAEVQRGKVKMKRLLEQTKPIVDGLVKTEALRLNAYAEYFRPEMSKLTVTPCADST
jgi:hypothetical protein